METAFISTPLGMARLEAGPSGIRSIRLEEGPVSRTISPVLQTAAGQLQAYFKGNRRHFDFHMDPQGTPFQKRVWAELRQIPFGHTLSYLELAKKLGDPAAIRAVAAANGKNPIWIAIPCHRVIGSDGALVGYAGGLHRKKWLLNHESPNPQQELFPH
jgi:methylated-DNA-[protein]-cysteine S-methyltransferase